MTPWDTENLTAPHTMRELGSISPATPDPITADMIRELRRGVAMIHAALADPARPRQSCGEVAAWWLRYADACVSHLSADRPAATLRGKPATGAKAREARKGRLLDGRTWDQMPGVADG